MHRWLSTEVFDFAEASHDAYGRLADPVVHRRRVLFVKPRYWVVIDDLEGRAEHTVELRFQFAPIKVTVDPDLWARAHLAGGGGLLIRSLATVPLKGEVHEGEVASIKGWISPDYGRRLPAPMVTYSTVTCLPLRVMTILLPTENPLVSPPAVSPLGDRDPGSVGVVFGDDEELVRVGEQYIIVEPGKPRVRSRSASGQPHGVCDSDVRPSLRFPAIPMIQDRPRRVCGHE